MFPQTLRAVIVGFLVPLLAAPVGAGNGVARTGADEPDLACFDEMMEGFMTDHAVPGAALAVARDGRLVYARGFGTSDPATLAPVLPRARFRIASISKPITAAAILRLIEMGKLKLDDHPFELLDVTPLPGQTEDPRLRTITIRQLLQHTGGFDRAKSGDPMFEPGKVTAALKIAGPPRPEQIMGYMAGRPLDFAPGSRFAYCNFGYCVLGRIIEKQSGQAYGAFVRDEILTPLAMRDTRLGTTHGHARGEVAYVDPKGRMALPVAGEMRSRRVPLPYAAWDHEGIDALGGWLSSAPDLVRFATALRAPEGCPVLSADSIRTLFARPQGLPGFDAEGKPRPAYYGCGWNVRVVGRHGAANVWHTGSFAGTATLLVHRHDGLCWAVLFNARENPRGQYLAGLIEPLVHRAAGRVRHWPRKDLFAREF